MRATSPAALAALAALAVLAPWAAAQVPDPNAAFAACPKRYQTGGPVDDPGSNQVPASAWQPYLPHVATLLPANCKQTPASLQVLLACQNRLMSRRKLLCSAPMPDGSTSCSSGGDTYLAGLLTSESGCAPSGMRTGFNVSFLAVTTFTSKTTWNLTDWTTTPEGLCGPGGDYTPHSFTSTLDQAAAEAAAEEAAAEVKCPGGVTKVQPIALDYQNGKVCSSAADKFDYYLEVSPTFVCGDGSNKTVPLSIMYSTSTATSSSTSYRDAKFSTFTLPG